MKKSKFTGLGLGPRNEVLKQEIIPFYGVINLMKSNPKWESPFKYEVVDAGWIRLQTNSLDEAISFYNEIVSEFK